MDSTLDGSIQLKQFTHIKTANYKIDTDGRTIPVSLYRYKHGRGLQVILCKTPGPLCSFEMVVPTVNSDNNGAAHALEHLIMHKSKNAPHPNVFADIVTQSYGVQRAATYRERTTFMARVVGELQSKRIVGAMLDHISDPLITEESVATQVCGDGKGVVVSELRARDNGVEKCALAARRLAYAQGSPYTYAHGGTVEGVRTLTVEGLRAYHKRFYGLENATLLLVGAFSEQFIMAEVLDQLPTVMLKGWGTDTRMPLDCSPQTKSATSAVVANGAFGLTVLLWDGPPIEDEVATYALAVVCRYLSGDESCVLHMRLVGSERAARAIAMSVIYSVPTKLSLVLLGVPLHGSHVLGEGGARACVVDELKQLCARWERQPGAELRVLRDRIVGYRDSLSHVIESNIEGYMSHILSIDIIASHYSPRLVGELPLGVRADPFAVLDELLQRPAEFWVAILRKLADAPVCEARTVPGKPQAASPPPSTTAKAASPLQSNSPPRTPERRPKNPKLPSPPKYSNAFFIRNTHVRVLTRDVLRPFERVLVVRYTSRTFCMHAHLSHTHIPRTARPFLRLFAGMLFTCDVDSAQAAGTSLAGLAGPDGFVTSRAAAHWRYKNAITLSVLDPVHANFMQPTHTVHTPGFLVLEAEAPIERACDVVDAMRVHLFGAYFSVARTLTTAQLLLDRMRACSPSSLAAHAVASTVAYNVPALDERLALEGLVAELGEDSPLSYIEKHDRVAGIFANIRESLATAATHRNYITLAVPDGPDGDVAVARMVVDTWARAPCRYIAGRPPGPLPREFVRFSKRSVIHVIDPDSRASHISITCSLADVNLPEALRVSRGGELSAYVAAILSDALSRPESVLAESLRTPGLAYSPRMFYSHTNALFGIVCDAVAGDPVVAFSYLISALHRLKNDWALSEHLMCQAYSAACYARAFNNSSPKLTYLEAVRAAARGFSDLNQMLGIEKGHERLIEMPLLMAAANAIMGHLADKSSSAVVVVVTPPGCRVNFGDIEVVRVAAEDLAK